MGKTAIVLLLVLLTYSCKPAEQERDTLFKLLSPSTTKVDFTNQLTESEQFNMIEYLYFNNGAGVAAGDINNDGLIDLYFISNQESNKLYLNKGNLTFEDITSTAGVAGEGDWKTGVTMADVNGDGFLDIYVCQVSNYKNLQGGNQLFVNQGDLTFKEEAQEYGLDFQGFSTQAAFFDFDIDGDLDMYLLNHSVHTSRSYGGAALRYEKDERAGDRLFRNEGLGKDPVFHDVTRQAGILSSQIGYGLGVNISDINNDGFPDIYVSNDFHENDYLYINNGNGSFSERLTEMLAHTSRSSMGNDVGDINNDGLLDVVVLDMLPDKEEILKQSGGEDDHELFQLKLDYGYYHQFVRNTLQLNLGGGKFSEIGRLAGIYATDWSWSPLFCDVDNDGWKDLFITNGIYRRANDLDYVNFLTGGNRNFPMRDNRGVPDKELYEKMPLYPNVNYIYKNNGDLTFSNMAEAWGFDTRSFSNGSAYADLDNDGDLDLIVNNINSSAYILQNNSSSLLNHHYLSVSIKGTGSNTRGVGTRVTLYQNGVKMVAEQYVTRGFMSATSHVLHFGLGLTRNIDSLVVRWPNRTVQVIRDLSANQLITLEMEQTEKRESGNDQIQENAKLFTRLRDLGLDYKHKEDAFVDLNRERLIPHNLSAEGPALAVGDVNGDGLDDLFVGGASGQVSMLFIQQNGGTFKSLKAPLFLNERYTEDVDAVLFDADGDNDLDLYVVRGGNEVPIGNPLLIDRLFVNDGKGGFTKKTEALPYMASNGSCVRPADYDGDGDLDLFVGSRSVPGGYGIIPSQYLLENDGNGFFTDVTDQHTSRLKDAGMVTDAQWIDYDLDDDLDLVLVGEWTKVRVYRNEEGQFTESTGAAGLDETSGWWNCIKAADVDLDGDMDLIGGNLGLNSMLKASTSEPVEMYLNDFDNNGSLDQVICSYSEGISYPIAALDELTGQISGLKERYPNYSDFAGKRSWEIFGKETLDESIRKKAVLFESCLFLNHGDGTFTMDKLPKIAQTSPIRDLFVHDIDLDGHPDLVVVGNNYSVRPSLGRYDASYGWCLLGTDQDFTPLMPLTSGLWINGDARKILPIEIKGKRCMAVAVNNGDLQLFQY
ncbi:MAG: VCBS repeat-containing protein [Bacteroidota bacterium]